MSKAFNCEGCYTVKTPTNVSSFENYWDKADECVIIHTHGSSTSLSNHGENGTTPEIISTNGIENLPTNNRIKFIMMTACKTASGTWNDNVAYWLSKRINSNGIVIANQDEVEGYDEKFYGVSCKATWKVYKNGVIQDPISNVILTMQDAYDIYQLYK